MSPHLPITPDEIARGCDAVINVSTGGGLGMTREERLRAAVATSLEMASLNVGLLSFGIFPPLEKSSPTVIEQLGYHVAIPAEARSRPALKGSENVAF